MPKPPPPPEDTGPTPGQEGGAGEGTPPAAPATVVSPEEQRRTIRDALVVLTAQAARMKGNPALAMSGEEAAQGAEVTARVIETYFPGLAIPEKWACS